MECIKKNSEILANIDFTKISEKKIMPQTGIEPVRVSLPTAF